MTELDATHGWPPRWLTQPPVGLGSRGARACDFIEAHCRNVKDSVGARAGDPIVLRPFQRRLTTALLTEDAGGRLRYRHALVGMPRKNGKSTWSAGLALFGLLFSGNGAEVYSCAGDRDQARIVFEAAKRMVEMDPELRQIVKVYQAALEVPATGSVYRVLSAEAPHQEGLSPTMVVFDELHVQPNDDLWSVMELASGARPEPLMMGITTAGVRTDSRGHDSLAYRMYKHGRDVASGLADDPSFFFAWYEPLAGVDADHRDPEVWAEANPGYDDIVAAVDFPSTLQRVHESDFRSKRLNIFTSARESWLPFGAVDACCDHTAHLEDGDTVILGFDGSIRSDATAIVAVRVKHGQKPFATPLRVWERPLDDPDWIVPEHEVLAAFREYDKRYRVTALCADTTYWQSQLLQLKHEGMNVIDFSQSPERLGRATQGLYEAIVVRGIVFDGNEVLLRHLNNAVLKSDSSGRGHIVKPQKSSEAHVDAAVALTFALDYAANHPGVGAGSMQHWRNEIAKQQAHDAEQPPPPASTPRLEVTGPSPSPRDILLGPGSALPGPRVACQHRWMVESWGQYCVHCGEKR